MGNVDSQSIRQRVNYHQREALIGGADQFIMRGGKGGRATSKLFSGTEPCTHNPVAETIVSKRALGVGLCEAVLVKSVATHAALLCALPRFPLRHRVQIVVQFRSRTESISRLARALHLRTRTYPSSLCRHGIITGQKIRKGVLGAHQSVCAPLLSRGTHRIFFRGSVRSFVVWSLYSGNDWRDLLSKARAKKRLNR